MTVLLTGATGTLGRALVEHLLKEGHAVRVLTRRPFLASDILPASVAIHEWHPGVDAVAPEAFRDVETVIHLAGDAIAERRSRNRLEDFRASRTGACESLIAAAGSRPWRLIAASMVTTSGDADAVLTEAARTAPLSAIESAVGATEAAALAAQARGARVTIVRFGLILAPAEPLASLARLAKAGFVPALEGARIPAIDLQDATAMLAGLIARTDLDGPVNAVAPTPLAGADLAQMLSAARRGPLRLSLPRTLMQRRIGLVAPLLFNRARIVPQRLAEIGASFRHPDPKASAERALAALCAARPAPPTARELLARAARLRKPKGGSTPAGPTEA